MKQPKRLTRNQKERVQKKGLNPSEWMFVKDIESSYFQVKHKTQNKYKTIAY